MQTNTQQVSSAILPQRTLAREWYLALFLVALADIALLCMGLLLPSVPHCPQVAVSAVEQRVLEPWARYDTCQYIVIARDGYGAQRGSTAFHPLFPLLMSAAGHALGGQFLLGGWLVSALCCMGAIFLLQRLVQLDHDVDVSQRAAMLLLFSPLGFSLLIPYTEAVLMLCVLGAFYAARKRRWALAGLAGFGAALTKQPGVVVLLPLLLELWQSERANLRARRFAPALGALAWLALTPFGLLVFLLFRATLGDVAVSLSNPMSFVDALLVTPQYREVWQEYFSWPWVNFLFAVDVLATRPYFYIIINVALMLVALAIIAFGLLRWRHSYALYAVVLTWLNLSIVYPLWPYMGIVRRFTIIFPIFTQLALWSRRPLPRLLIIAVSGSLWALITMAYLRKAFVP
jgi:hypothetical protein